MDERREQRPDGEIPGLRNPDGRISLRRLDALIQGELSPAEAEALRKALGADPAARAYVERQSALRSGRGYEDIRTALRESRRPLLERLLAAARLPGPRGGRNAFLSPGFGAAAAFACLLLGASLWIGRGNPPGQGAGGRLGAKGAFGPEISLRHRGSEFFPGALVPARSGDTLVLAYRSVDSLRVQIWYQEDGGRQAPMTGPGGFALPPATSWTEAVQRIRLDGTWTRQRMWIVLSRQALDAEAASAAVRRGRGDGDAEVAAYSLSAPGN
jgi:hypothetical protein